MPKKINWITLTLFWGSFIFSGLLMASHQLTEKTERRSWNVSFEKLDGSYETILFQFAKSGKCPPDHPWGYAPLVRWRDGKTARIELGGYGDKAFTVAVVLEKTETEELTANAEFQFDSSDLATGKIDYLKCVGTPKSCKRYSKSSTAKAAGPGIDIKTLPLKVTVQGDPIVYKGATYIPMPEQYRNETYGHFYPEAKLFMACRTDKKTSDSLSQKYFYFTQPYQYVDYKHRDDGSRLLVDFTTVKAELISENPLKFEWQGIRDGDKKSSLTFEEL